MHRFSAPYLRESRRDLWTGDREALAPLALDRHDRILDVGAGTGAFTRLLAEESDAEILALDADRRLVGDVTSGRQLVGDAMRLPFNRGTVDLAVCQALLVNLPDPSAAIRELARVSTDLVAAAEPDNEGVRVESTVPDESRLARRARSAYIDGHDADAALGADAATHFREAGLREIRTTRHVRVRTTAPPYDEWAVREARRRVQATRIEANRETILSGEVDTDEFQALRDDWRSMGRTVVDQMSDGEYRREETFPIYVTVGRVPEASRNTDSRGT